MAVPNETKDRIINIRATSREVELIDQAARAAHKSRSDFMLEAATQPPRTPCSTARSFRCRPRNGRHTWRPSHRRPRSPPRPCASCCGQTRRGVDPGGLSAPVRLSEQHEIGDFSCGDEGVDAWLRDRAGRAQAAGTARTFVVCEGVQIVAYYCLSNATFQRAGLASARTRSGMPTEVPAILVGQLGVDDRYQGLGRLLLRDAMGRALAVSEHSGVVVMHLHVSTDAARDYYLHLDLGFQVSHSEPRTLYLPLATIRQALLSE